MIDLSVRRPVATAALYVGLLALGLYSLRLVPVELLPEVDFPRLLVEASWRGASPELMEAAVTAPLESVAQQVKGVRKVVSVSEVDARGLGSVSRLTLEFERDARMDFARLELRERIASLRDELPSGVSPYVRPYVPEELAEESRPTLSYRLRGPYTGASLADLAERELRPRLLALDGVSEVRVTGGRDRVLSVVLDPARLEALGIRPEQVRARLEDLQELRAPGAVELAGRRVSLAVRTRAETLEEVRGLVIAPERDVPIRLGDVASVEVALEEPTGYFRIDGQPAVTTSVHRRTGTNAIRLAARVRARVDSLRGSLPPGAALELEHDESEDIAAQLLDLRTRAGVSALVIFLVLLAFLRSLGSVLVVFATIGFSVLAAVNFLYLGGFSLNTLTMAGLAWGFGLVVDNAIVVLENVQRRRERGEPPDRAARLGARQVALPVVAATATTAIVLVPFLLLQGELRLWYVPLGWAVGFSILASLFVAFTFVPSMSARVRGGIGRNRRAPPSDGGSPDAVARRPPLYVRGYRALLEAALDHPLLVLTVCAASLAGSWYFFDRHVNRGVRWADFWGRDTYIDIRITYPRGAGLERTDRLVRSFEEKLAALPEVERFEATVRPRYGYIKVTFPEELETTAVPVAIKEQMVAYSHGFSGAEVRVYGYGPSFYGGGGSPPNYSVTVLGFSYLKVQEIAEGLASSLEGFSRIRDVDPDASGRWYQSEKAFEYFVRPDRSALAGTGVSVEDLLWHVSASVAGETRAGERAYLGGEELPLSLKLKGYEELDFLELAELRIPAEGERRVRLADVAEVDRRTVLARVERENQEYRRNVAWEFRGPRKLGDIVRDVALENTELPPGYRIEKENRFTWSTEEQRQVWMAVVLAVFLIFLVTAVLFESLSAPFVVLLTLPLSLIGVFLIFFYTGATFTRTAYIGAIMMAGIVVNNAILVVYHIGELRRTLPLREALLRGTLERVRPILMTTLTTVFGLLPLILFASSQDANVWNALVLATVGGLLSSTLFVLVATPVAYRYLVARGSSTA